MFPKTNNDPKKNQQPQAKDENVRKKAQEEERDLVQPMGNEAAALNLMSDLIHAVDEGGKPGPDPDKVVDAPGGMKENNSGPAKQGNNPPEINNPPGNLKPEEKGGAGGNAPVQNLVQQVIRQAANVPAAVEEEKPEFYEDPAGLDLDSLDPDNPLNRDLIVENPIRKRGKNKKKKKSSKSNVPGNALGAAGQDMGPAAGLNFSVQKLPARKRASWFRRFLTATAYYAGKSIGETLNFIGNLFYVPLSGNLGKLWRGRSGNKENAKVTQEKRDHDTIPGWNGAKYEKGPGKNNEVLADFRRVPTVWSYLTAQQAEDEKGDPLPPKVGIYINQPKEGEDKDINWLEFGHSGIGVEYSRYSRVSKRYERYMLRYGFYMAGASVSAGIMGDAKGAITPGMLRDESNSMYTISRTFKATAKQVSDILNASETWADKGYNASTRNCTTFVKEMVRDVAHLPLGSDIFTEDRVRLSSLANFGHFGEVSSTTNAKIGMETDFEKLGQMDDMTYAGFGNKRTNKEEYRRYKDSIEEGRRVKYADTPNSAVENMRRLEGPYAGEIGSLQYTGSMPRNRNKKLERTYQTVSRALDDAGKDAANKILQVTGKTDQQINAMFMQNQEFVVLFNMLKYGVNAPILEAETSNMDPESLREARKNADQTIRQLNTLLFKYLKNDKRLHLPILHVISLLNHGIEIIDFEYRNSERGSKEGDLGNIRAKMDKNLYPVKAGGKKTNMSPTHYESYLQIYKNPQQAVEKHARYMELKQIDEDPNQHLSGAEKKEYEKAKRIESLAGQFDKSHRYMIEKGSYSQQDVDYVFSLSDKERQGDANGGILSNSTSGIYKSLILEKIFGGMKQRYLNSVSTEQCKDIPTVKTWLEDDLNSCVLRKKDDLTAVIRALTRTSELKEMDYLMFLFRQMMNDMWFAKDFTHGPKTSPLRNGPNTILEAFASILEDNQSRFKNTLTGIFRFILSEDEIAKPDSLQGIGKE